ncbi:MAG: ketopantoate reductase family protein [bacterium]
MNILIYGGGAVGLGIASCLLKSGAQIDIIGREDTVLSLQRDGLVRQGIFGHYASGPEMFGSFVSLEDIPPRIYDYILVCTKSFDSETAAKDISSHGFILDQGTKIILFQNGWGNAEIFIHAFPKRQVYNARVITGFSRPKPNEVVITVHADAIHIGSLFLKDVSGLHDLCVLITRGGIPCEFSEHIERDIWAKMLYNCALNPLGAILNVPYGKLGEYEYTRVIMEGIVKEIFEVIGRGGYKTHWESPEDYLKIFYERLLPPTALHESSTLQDIRARKRTEIDALNGAIVELAGKLRIEIPFNRMVYNLVKFMEIRNLTT